MHRLWHVIEDYDEEFSKPIANPATSDIMTYKELYLNNELLTVLGAHNLNRSCIEFSGQSINSSIKHIYFFSTFPYSLLQLDCLLFSLLLSIFT